MEERWNQGEDPHPQPLSQPATFLPECIRALVWQVGGRGEPERGTDNSAYWEISLSLKQKMTEVAREFRKEPTVSEHILWQALRGRKLDGYKFRRQQPIGVFIVDFFCSSELLVVEVEVDGRIHESQREHDQQRQELLESLGLRLVRITSEQVETDLSSALAIIR